MICIWSEVFVWYVSWNIKGFRLTKTWKNDVMHSLSLKLYNRVS